MRVLSFVATVAASLSLVGVGYADASPQLTVTPSTNVPVDQMMVVSVTGFPANTFFFVGPCYPNEFGCQLFLEMTDASGSWTNYIGAGSFAADLCPTTAAGCYMEATIPPIDLTVPLSFVATPLNNPPNAQDQSVTVARGTPKAITLTGSDLDGDVLTYSIVNGPSHGTLSGTPPNVTYTPTGIYTGLDSFSFRTNDGMADSNLGTLSLSVRVNSAPRTSNSNVSTSEDTPVSFTVSATDSNGDALTYTITQPPTHGTLAGTGPGYTYTPAQNYNGNDVFQFAASDGFATSGASKVSIKISAVNDAPVALDQTAATGQGVPRQLTLQATDADGDTLSYQLVTSALHGSVTVVGTSALYTPVTGYCGPDSFSFRASDARVFSNVAAVSLTVGGAVGQWCATGSMMFSRLGATATRLGNGKILVAGGIGSGSGPSGFDASAELYDPGTGTWTTTGSMSEGRYLHEAFLLHNGKVLVTASLANTTSGGARTELYDPASGTWSPTGSMSRSHFGGLAALLLDGQVLVAGGDVESKTAELYDPATGTWSVTAPMASTHGSGMSALLPDGRFLVAGGASVTTSPWSVTLTSSAEVYNPVTGTWSATGSLSASRVGAKMVGLMDGSVLVAGGWTTGQTLIARSEVYKTATGVWTSTGSLATPRSSSFTLTLLANGKTLAAGGSTQAGCVGCNTTPSAELYDPTAGTWSVTGSLSVPRERHNAVLLPSGNVIAIGGSNRAVGALKTAEIYKTS
jgi:Big-like domain-containing protein/Kelch motif protein